VGGAVWAHQLLDHQGRLYGCDRSVYLPQLLEFATVDLLGSACVRVSQVRKRLLCFVLDVVFVITSDDAWCLTNKHSMTEGEVFLEHTRISSNV
jgi:hypothetical protein